MSNSPKIRFKGFTDDWEQRKLGELMEDGTILEQSDGNHGELYPRSEEFANEGIPYIAASSISSDGESIDFNLTKYLPVERAKQFRKGVAKNGDVLLAHNATVGPSVMLSMDYDFAVLSTSLTLYRLNDRKMSPIFFLQAIRSEYFQKQLEVFMKQTTRSQVPILTQRNLQICYTPNIDEQQKIGDYFRNLDNLITLHQHKCAETKELKKAMLQKMFPKNGEKQPEIRFEGFTDDWEQRKLGEVIADLKSGLSRQLDNADIGLPVVRANNINDGRLDMKNNVKYWYKDDPQGADTSNYLIHKNDILINFINSEAKMGTATIVDEEPDRDTIYTTNILKMQADNTVSDSLFLLYLTMTYHYCNYIKSITKPAVNQASFTTVDYKNYSFLMPSLEEQKRIGEYLSILDNLITLHQRKCDMLKEMKRYMLKEELVYYPELSKQILQQINELRANSGLNLKPLTWSEGLSMSARMQAGYNCLNSPELDDEKLALHSGYGGAVNGAGGWMYTLPAGGEDNRGAYMGTYGAGLLGDGSWCKTLHCGDHGVACGWLNSPGHLGALMKQYYYDDAFTESCVMYGAVAVYSMNHDDGTHSFSVIMQINVRDTKDVSSDPGSYIAGYAIYDWNHNFSATMVNQIAGAKQAHTNFNYVSLKNVDSSFMVNKYIDGIKSFSLWKYDPIM